MQKAAPSDVEAVRSLNALLRTGVRDFYWDADSYVRSAVAVRKCHLVKEAGKVRGALIVESQRPDSVRGDKCLVIETLVVDPRHRGRGIGSELVEFAKRLSFEQDRRLYVESFFEYGKPDYYRRMGFKSAKPGTYRGRPYHVLCFDPRPIPVFPRMKRIGIGDRLQYLYHLQDAPVVSGDMTFERLFLRDGPSREIRLCLLHGNVVVLEMRDGSCNFYPVVGSAELERTVLECLDWLNERSGNGRFIRVPLCLVSAMAPQARSRLRIAVEPGNGEWQYRTSNLFAAKGPGSARRKQSLDAFMKKAPELRLEAASLKKEIMSWHEVRSGEAASRDRTAKSARRKADREEERGLRKALVHSASLGLLTAGLYVRDALGGFSVAGVNGKTGFFHFEKALPERGARQALLHLFGRELHRRGIQIVNRYPDLDPAERGAEGILENPIGRIEKRSLRLRSS